MLVGFENPALEELFKPFCVVEAGGAVMLNFGISWTDKGVEGLIVRSEALL